MTITAVFGVDDFTEADIECMEARDQCDIEVAGTGVLMDITESADQCVIGCAALVTADITEARDGCLIVGQIGSATPSAGPGGLAYLVMVPEHDYTIEVVDA